jgi:GNAT superfamily N-acetyltransferase
MSSLTFRQAATDDLDELQAIYYATFDEGAEALPPRPATLLPALPHIMATGELLVAEHEGRIAGFSGLITRGSVAFLTDLFVRPDVQSGGIGQALLERILPRDGRILATAASTDPRAPALYIRAGMRPQAPLFWLLGESARLENLAPSDLDTREAEVGDPALVAWDTAICGRPRAEDLVCLVRGFAAQPLWFERAGRRIGYGFVQQRSPEALWHQQAYTLGPIGAYTPEDATACTLAAAQWARSRGESLRIGVLGSHPALAELLRAGMRIAEIETFLASAPFVDGQRYLPSGGSLL